MDPKTPTFHPPAPPAKAAKEAGFFSYEEVTQILKNSGIDVDCGACAEVAFTGVTTNAHTCTKLDAISAVRAELAAAKQILRDTVAAGVLTDGFMTMAVGQSLLNQAAAAKTFLEQHP